MKKKQPVEYSCNFCKKKVSLPEWRYKKIKNKNLCGKCSVKRAREEYRKRLQNDKNYAQKHKEKVANGLKKWHAKRSFEEKSNIGKYARSKVKMSGKELREKQQKFIDTSSKEYYEKYCEKRRQIALNFHSSLSDKEKEEHYKKVFKDKGISKAAGEFLDVVKDTLKLQLIPEFYVKGFFCDALIENTNILIEFFGDVYHCNPKKFTDPEQYCSWIGRTVKEQWKRDEIRTAALLRNGYSVIIVWEDDWKNKPENVIKRIKNEMYKN